MKKPMIRALAIIVLIGALPLVSLLSAVAVTSLYGCALDEGSVHPCLVLGHDLGELFYAMAVSAWLMFFTLPAAALALVVWLIVIIVARIRRRKATRA